jgi:putative ABC transport system permease protein
MLIKLAWRNLWRNKRRTLITAASIFFAVLLAIFMNSIQAGAYERMIDNLVGQYMGYIQIHKKGYWEEPILDNSFSSDGSPEAHVLSHPSVSQAIPRLEANALASSGNTTRVIRVVGVDPTRENDLSMLESKLVAGTYFLANDRSVLIAEGMAECLGLGLGDSITLLGQGYQAVSAAGLYPISGVAHFGSPELNKSVVFLPLSEAQRLYGAEERLTSYALKLSNANDLPGVVKDLREGLSDEYEVMDWKEMMPEFVEFMKVDTGGNYIFLGVLYLIITFGMFGTVLMMTKEREYEFGVMLAIGMKRMRLASVIVLETLMISFLGVLAGSLVALPLILYFHVHPIYMGAEAEKVYATYGFEALFPTSTDPKHFLINALLVFIIAMLISLHPIMKISRLKPVEAMRS